MDDNATAERMCENMSDRFGFVNAKGTARVVLELKQKQFEAGILTDLTQRRVGVGYIHTSPDLSVHR